MRRLTIPLLIILIAGFFSAGYAVRRSYGVKLDVADSSLPSGNMSAYAAESGRSDVGTRSDIDISPMETFYSVLRLLKEHFVEPINDSQRKDLAYGSLKNMLDSLKDPNTRFLEPSNVALIEDARQGKFHGVGAMFGVRRVTNGDGTFEQLVVISPLPGSPAEKAGLKTGDIITEVDGKSVLPYDPYQKANKLIKAARNGEIEREKLQKMFDAEEKRITDGISFETAMDQLSASFKDQVELTVDRGGQPQKMKVGSDDISVSPVEHAVKNGVGYIDLNLLSMNSRDEFSSALADIESKDAKGLVIDLRDNPGGAIDSAVQIARFFAPEKPFAIVARSGKRRETVKVPSARTDETAKPWTKPVVVLVDQGTSSAAELLAGALRDSDGAKLVGEKTFGQAFEITLIPQKDGSAVQMTTGKFLTPKGTDFSAKGLKTDVDIKGNDAQLDKAMELAKAG